MIDKWIVISLIKSLAYSLIVTEILEIIAAACFPQRNKRDFLLVFLVNVVTNPVVVYLNFWFHFQVESVMLWIISMEFSVWLLEAFIYRKCLTVKHNPFLYSFVLNAVSYFGGIFIDKVL